MGILTIEESLGFFSDSTRQHDILAGRGWGECLSCLVLLLGVPAPWTTAVGQWEELEPPQQAAVGFALAENARKGHLMTRLTGKATVFRVEHVILQPIQVGEVLLQVVRGIHFTCNQAMEKTGKASLSSQTDTANGTTRLSALGIRF